MKTESSNIERDMVSGSSNTYSNVKIGDRVECAGCIGTIKYIGPVKSHPSNWFGIDWDDQNRGKHNGTLNGIEYFQARFPNSGSFVRPEKVNLGQSVVTSIIGRYGRREDENTSKQLQRELFHFQRSINAPFLELVGFDEIVDKQSNYDSLRVVNLRLQNINSAGPPGQLKCLCANIRELDLSKNLISSWETVFEICSQLDQLYWLNLSENRLSIPEDMKNYHFPSVKVLICTAMFLTWEDIWKISIAFPNIQELRVPMNCIHCLNTPLDVLQGLRVLDIENNSLEKWSEVCKLSVLKNLEELFIGNISLRKIEFLVDAPKVDIFRNLKKLSISHNPIDDWQSINELNKMISLEDLRCVKIPLLETLSEANRFQLIVARIENLKVFNGTQITAAGRRGAEYDYMKMYGMEWLNAKHTSEGREEFLRLHNRYMQLINMYGELEESELLTKPKSIKSTLITLDLVYEGKIVTKKLPHTIFIQKLMLLAQKTFKLDSRPNLIYVSKADSTFKIDLDDSKDINFYSMEDGDQILVNL